MLLMEKAVSRISKSTIIQVENSFGDVFMWSVFILVRYISAEIHIDRIISGALRESVINIYWIESVGFGA